VNARVKLADKLTRDYVLARDRFCLYCGSPENLEWCHIVTRAARYLRWDPDNAVTFCHGDHAYFTDHPNHFRIWLAERFGPDHRGRLLRMQADAERRGDAVDVEAVIRSFRDELTSAESAAYRGGDW